MLHTLSRLLGTAALALSLATAGSAGAAERPVDPRAVQAPSYRVLGPSEGSPPPPSIAPNRRTITSKVVYRDGRLWLRGDVQSYSGRPVAVQKRRCETCRWKLHDVTRTTRNGWFRSVIRAPRHGSTYWRARVAPSDGYVRSFSATWQTYY